MTYEPRRAKLADTRSSMTRKIQHGSYEAYVTIGFFSNNQPGEVFVKIAKEGTSIGGLVDIICRQISYMLQLGIPLKWMFDKESGRLYHHKFDPLDEFGRSLMDSIGDACMSLCSDFGGRSDVGCFDPTLSKEAP